MAPEHMYRQQWQYSVPCTHCRLQQQTEQLEAQLVSDVSGYYSLATCSTSGAVLEYWRPAGRGELLALKWPNYCLRDFFLRFSPYVFPV